MEQPIASGVVHYFGDGSGASVIEKTIVLVARIRTTDAVTLSPHMLILEPFLPQHPVDEGDPRPA